VALGGKLMGANRSGATAAVMTSESGSIGDKSSYSPILGAYVLKDDVLLEFNNLLPMSDAKPNWEKLARTALGRI
jgi:hypothetical protein